MSLPAADNQGKENPPSYVGLDIPLSRNYGIDALRIAAMMMVLILHLVGATHVLPLENYDSALHRVGWLLEIAAYCGVNCYALITGYVCCEGSFKYERVVTLWFQVIFYTAGSLALAMLFLPQAVHLESILSSFFPVLTGQYWYVTAYVGLFFFIPFLNVLGRQLTKLQFQYLLVTVLVLFSVIPTLIHKDVFPVSGGYSVWWLGILYMLGMYIKKYGFFTGMKTGTLWALYAGCVFFVWSFKMILDVVSPLVIGQVRGGGMFIAYNSPFIVGTAVSLFLIFSRMRFSSRRAIACISWLAAASFSVYVIHCNLLLGRLFLWDLFGKCASSSPVMMVVKVVAMAVAVYLACSLVDSVRRYLFKMVDVNRGARAVVGFFGKLGRLCLKMYRRMSLHP
ncbi:acyltransferase [Akkermansia muciniphila]|uniref:acyltransferase n=1 Tax=Akkermansia muciniphila TaxID=239935 RepID=UPI0033AAE0D6